MKLAIISPRKRALTETFIQSHFDFLNADITHYYGGNFPTHQDNVPLMNEVSWARKLRSKGSRYLNPLALSVQEHALLASLRKTSPDVVLIEYGNIAAEIIRVLEILNIPFVVHYHGFDSSVYHVIEKYKAQYARVFSLAHALIVVSSKMKNDLLALGAPEDKVKHICYGPYPFFSELQPDYSAKRLVAVGRFVDKKAPHISVLAFHKILPKHPDAHLTFVGSGPLKRICEDIVRSLHLENNVHFLGDRPPETVAGEMQKSRAFVQHSRIAENGDSEGTPLSVLESQLAALPVIATYHAGIADVVLHGGTGLLCEENDVERMAENMDVILSDDELCRRLGENARKRIRESYTMEKYIAALQQQLDIAASRK